MKYRAITLLLMFICFVCSVSGQQIDREQKDKYVVIPDEVVLATIASQPGCPLQFEDANVLAAMDGSQTSGYTIRNIGAKPIRSFTVGLPGGVIETWSEAYKKRSLMPGEKTPGDDNVEIVPLTDELRNKLKLNGPMRTLVLFMVIWVEYADGTVYSAEPAYKAFKKYAGELIELNANRKSQ